MARLSVNVGCHTPFFSRKRENNTPATNNPPQQPPVWPHLCQTLEPLFPPSKHLTPTSQPSVVQTCLPFAPGKWHPKWQPLISADSHHGTLLIPMPFPHCFPNFVSASFKRDCGAIHWLDVGRWASWAHLNRTCPPHGFEKEGSLAALYCPKRQRFPQPQCWAIRNVTIIRLISSPDLLEMSLNLAFLLTANPKIAFWPRSAPMGEKFPHHPAKTRRKWNTKSPIRPNSQAHRQREQASCCESSYCPFGLRVNSKSVRMHVRETTALPPENKLPISKYPADKGFLLFPGLLRCLAGPQRQPRTKGLLCRPGARSAAPWPFGTPVSLGTCKQPCGFLEEKS